MWFDDSPHLAVATDPSIKRKEKRKKRNERKTGQSYFNSDTDHQVHRLLVCMTPVVAAQPEKSPPKKAIDASSPAAVPLEELEESKGLPSTLKRPPFRCRSALDRTVLRPSGGHRGARAR